MKTPVPEWFNDDIRQRNGAGKKKYFVAQGSGQHGSDLSGSGCDHVGCSNAFYDSKHTGQIEHAPSLNIARHSQAVKSVLDKSDWIADPEKGIRIIEAFNDAHQ